MTPALLAGLTGVLQGARHALEPDHVTAVATVMVESPSQRRGMFYAGCWGMGHASMLVLVGAPLLLLRVQLSEHLSALLELGVGAMLVGLGIQTLRRARHTHRHEEQASLLARGRRPFAIGLMHGLAGSGALAALIALAAPTTMAGLACLGLYAFGTVLGMVGLASIAGPLMARAGRLPNVAGVMVRVAGAASIVVGVVWAVRTLASMSS
jgi:high-affinity nickel permease